MPRPITAFRAGLERLVELIDGLLDSLLPTERPQPIPVRVRARDDRRGR